MRGMRCLLLNIRGLFGTENKLFGLEEQINVAEEVIASALCAAEMDEPKTMNQAQKRPDAVKWMKAAQEEMDSLLEHDNWSLTKPPLGRKVIGSRWVFKIKHDENGDAERYKCRLVAQGYTQAQGTDYHETFAPVARFGSIRTLLAIAAKRRWMSTRWTYIRPSSMVNWTKSQPERFEVEGKEDLVCNLHRSLYGLKQSPRCWNKAGEEWISAEHC